MRLWDSVGENWSCTNAMHLILTLTILLWAATDPCCCGMTDELRKEALDAHNYLRQNVYPEAVGMSKMTWSSKLEALAEKAAKMCQFEHTSTKEFAGKGENMYLGGKSNFTEILTMMFLERELYDFKNQKCLAGTPEYSGPYTFFSTCGHYLQIVRSDMNTVGCSINSCKNPDGSSNNLAVCEYESMYRQPPYRARKPNENPCELCGYGGYTTDCEDGMCIPTDAEQPKRYKGTRKCLNCGAMQYYGTFDYCDCGDNFFGEVCEYPFKSVLPRSFTSGCDKCKQEGVECMNGGQEASSGDTCECVCDSGFTGDYCETNIEEESHTLHLYLGGSKRYNSYYPVDKSVWKSVDSHVEGELATALSNSCASGRPHVKLSSNYPAATLNGALKVGLNAKCRNKYIPKSDLQAALESSRKRIGDILGRAGVRIVNAE